tara:strand:+ start:155 stop:370 length:216 start_codon:yes stop_codon:yes gene_type:complete
MDTLRTPFRKATSCDIHVSGAEFNVAANLADCFDCKTGGALCREPPLNRVSTTFFFRATNARTLSHPSFPT